MVEHGLPEGTFSLLQGTTHELGTALVSDPRIQAVGFTGSRRGGLALVAAAQQRPEPIPVYAEMSSVNPVFLLPGVLAERADATASAYVTSVTGSAGQLCTQPGLVFALEGGDRYVRRRGRRGDRGRRRHPDADRRDGRTRSIRRRGDRRAPLGSPPLGTGKSDDSLAYPGLPQLFVTDGDTFLASPELAGEVFGPTSLVVRVRDTEQLRQIVDGLEGQLTASVHLTEADHDAGRRADRRARAGGRPGHRQRLADRGRGRARHGARRTVPGHLGPGHAPRSAPGPSSASCARSSTRTSPRPCCPRSCARQRRGHASARRRRPPALITCPPPLPSREEPPHDRHHHRRTRPRPAPCPAKNATLIAAAAGDSTLDRIAHLKLSSITLPLATPISDAKVLTGRQKPMTEVAFLFVEVTTQNGHTGIGFSYSKRAGGPGQFAHAKEIADVLIGEDPSDIGKLWVKLCWAGASVGRSGLATQAIAAFDVALWDLKAKRAGLPLPKLLGSYRDSVRTYNTSGGFLHTPIEQVQGELRRRAGERHRRHQAQGRPARLAHRRGPGHRGPGVPRRRRPADGRRQPAVGPGQRRCGWAGSSRSSVWSGSRSRWTRTTPRATPQLARALDTPIATGEMLASVAEHARLIEVGAADIVQPDAPRIGGITQFLKLAALAESKQLEIAPHFAMEIHCHLAAAYPIEPWVEHFDWLDPLFNEHLETRDGRMWVSDRPGLGFTLSEQAARLDRRNRRVRSTACLAAPRPEIAGGTMSRRPS